MHKHTLSKILLFLILVSNSPVWATNPLQKIASTNVKAGIDLGLGFHSLYFIPKRAIPFKGLDIPVSPNTSLGLILGYDFPLASVKVSPELGINYNFARTLTVSYLKEKITYKERYIQLPLAVKIGANKAVNSVNISGYIGYEVGILLGSKYNNSLPTRLAAISDSVNEDAYYIQEVINEYPEFIEEVINKYPGIANTDIVKKVIDNPNSIEAILNKYLELVTKVRGELSTLSKKVDEYDKRVEEAISSLPKLSGSIFLGGLLDLPKGFYMGIKFKIPAEIFGYDFNNLTQDFSSDNFFHSNKSLVRVANSSLLEFNLGVDIMKWL